MNVVFNPLFRANRGSLAQLVVNIKDMTTRLGEPNSENQMQVRLYPIIKEICMKLYTRYEELLTTVSNEHLREFSYFLMGPYGNGTLRRATSNRMERKQYKYSELGPSFRAISNRLYHAIREVSSRLESEKYSSDVQVYTALKEFLTTFSDSVNEYSNEWKTTVYRIREELGVTVNSHSNNNTNNSTTNVATN